MDEVPDVFRQIAERMVEVTPQAAALGMRFRLRLPTPTNIQTKKASRTGFWQTCGKELKAGRKAGVNSSECARGLRSEALWRSEELEPRLWHGLFKSPGLSTPMRGG